MATRTSNVKRRKSKRGITTTVIVPWWVKALQSAGRKAKLQLLYVFAAIGACVVMYQVMIFLAAHAGGG